MRLDAAGKTEVAHLVVADTGRLLPPLCTLLPDRPAAAAAATPAPTPAEASAAPADPTCIARGVGLVGSGE